MKKVQRKESDLGDIFPESGQVSVLIANLFEEYMRLFDELEKAAISKAKNTDNKVENLQKLIDEAAKEMENEPPTAKSNPSLHGESSTTIETNKASFEGEDSVSSPSHKG